MKKKYTTIAITAAVTGITILALLFFVITTDTTTAPITYDTELSAFEWPDGVALVHMTTVRNSSEVGVLPGDYIVSTDGRVSTQIDATSFEKLNETELLIAGRINANNLQKRVENPFYYITPEEVRTIDTDIEFISDLSLAPSQRYIKYTSEERLCASSFDFQTLGECKDIKALIPKEWKTSDYFLDQEWAAQENKFILRVRSNEIHDEVPSKYPNTPPERVQREMARFSYNAETETLEDLSLESEIVLKKSWAPTNTENQPRGLIAVNGYRIIFDRGGSSLGIEEISTGKKARLMDAPYFGEMTGFDLK